MTDYDIMFKPCPKCKGKGWYYREQNLSTVKIGPSQKIDCDYPGCMNGQIQVVDVYKRTDVYHHKDRD